MTKNEIINYWIQSSDKDTEAMEHLFEAGDYSWALFIGHLVIEKLLKAYYVKMHSKSPPPIHSLHKLAKLSELEINDEKISLLQEVSTFNIKGRYNDYKMEFQKKCTKSFTAEWLNRIKNLRSWIKKQL